MTDHYYSESPQIKSRPQKWQTQLFDQKYVFHTDDGVFSKNRIDFGTRLLVESFKEPDVKGEFLDLGCGYGAIGISLANEFPNRHLVMVDINKRAVDLTAQNIEGNAIDNAEVFYSNSFSHIKDRSFASIITNPPIRTGKKVIYQMFEESKKHLTLGGTLWLVIQKKQGAPSAKRKLEEIFSSVQTIRRKKGYFILCAYNT